MDTFLILMELILWYKTTVFSVGFGIIFNITFKFISWNVLFICYYGLNKDWKNTSLFYLWLAITTFQFFIITQIQF